jgi:hypothetical protein
MPTNRIYIKKQFQRENRIGTKIDSETVLSVEFLNENRKWVNREFPRNSLVVRDWFRNIVFMYSSIFGNSSQIFQGNVLLLRNAFRGKDRTLLQNLTQHKSFVGFCVTLGGRGSKDLNTALRNKITYPSQNSPLKELNTWIQYSPLIFHLMRERSCIT